MDKESPTPESSLDEADRRKTLTPEDWERKGIAYDF